MTTGFTEFCVKSLAIDPTSPSTLYAGMGNGVLKSTDGAETWVAMNAGLPTLRPDVVALAIAPSSPSTLYAGTGDFSSAAASVFRSVDGGATWTAANSGLTINAVLGLAVDPAAPATVYLVATAPPGSGSVFKTTNGGASWAPASNGLAGVRSLAVAIDRLAPSTIYLGTSGSGVFKTTDGGASWTAVNTGLSNLTVFTVAADPLRSGTVYAGTIGGGVFRSTDGGARWAAVNDGLTSMDVRVLTTNPSEPLTLYAGTAQGGVFKITFADGTACASNSTTLCLNAMRFRVAVAWRAVNIGASGLGQAVPLTSDTGHFWFFSSNNIELVVKAVDGRAFNGRFWVFYGALSDVEYTVTVTDTQTGATRTYFNPQGQLASVADTSAF